ncbi:hypothetical protein NEIFL0001_0069 [Neisseria flavescens SK114]|nr:hypothetical protein NEIFL0001_0069 [Neisseria flavescens SK114]
MRCLVDWFLIQKGRLKIFSDGLFNDINLIYSKDKYFL